MHDEVYSRCTHPLLICAACNSERIAGLLYVRWDGKPRNEFRKINFQNFQKLRVQNERGGQLGQAEPRLRPADALQSPNEGNN